MYSFKIGPKWNMFLLAYLKCVTIVLAIAIGTNPVSQFKQCECE